MAAAVKVAVIGSTGRGDYGHGLDVMWRDVPECQLVAVADDNPQGLEAAGNRLQVTARYADYRQMLDRERPDVVAIAPRWVDRHAEMALAAAERGIHIYQEKPFCRTPAEADQVIQACERAHVRLALAHQTRYSPKLPRVQSLIQEGRLGRVLEIRGRGKEDQRGGGEDLWVLGSHLMNLAVAVAGSPRKCCALVTLDGRAVTEQDFVDGNEGLGRIAGDAVHALFELEQGTMFSFDSVRKAAGSPSRFGLQIFGSQGVLEMTTGYLPSVKLLNDPAWSPGRSSASWQDVSSAGVGLPEPLTDTGAHGGNVTAAIDLLSAIREQREPLCGMYDGRTTVEMITAVFTAQRRQTWVAWPLEDRGSPARRASRGASPADS